MEITHRKLGKIQFWIIALALLSGLILSIVSYLEICTEECRAGHDWKLFNLPFGPIGMFSFSALLIAHFLSLKWPILNYAIVGGVAAALGGEIVLILIQKYQIGHWCPVCLGIFASFLVVALVYIYNFVKDINYARSSAQKGTIMNSAWKGIFTVGAFALGIAAFTFGVVKENKLEAMENSVKEQIAFGKTDSTVNVYLFTDWNCPACNALEPKLNDLMPSILKQTRVVFVDIPVHPETLNYSPFNLSFMINNKPQYLRLRNALTALSQKTGTPSEAQIEALAKENGTKFKELNYADVALGLKYWKDLSTQFKVEATPTMIIVNPKNKKGKKLAGLEEITEANIQKAIDTLK